MMMICKWQQADLYQVHKIIIIIVIIIIIITIIIITVILLTSAPCGMGEIKSFETACCWHCVPCRLSKPYKDCINVVVIIAIINVTVFREDSIVAQEDLCLKCPHGYVANYFKVIFVGN